MKKLDKVTKEERHKYQAEMKDLIQRAMAPAKELLGNSYAMIFKYLEYGEFALAWETVLDLVDEQNIRLPQASLYLMKEAGEKLGLDKPKKYSRWPILLELLTKYGRSESGVH